MELWAGLPHWRRRMDFNRTYRELAANAAARAGIEVAADAGRIDGGVGPQPDGHAIARVSGIVPFGFGTHRENLADGVENFLPEEKPRGKGQIGARRAHTNRERGTVPTKLQT